MHTLKLAFIHSMVGNGLMYMGIRYCTTCKCGMPAIGFVSEPWHDVVDYKAEGIKITPWEIPAECKAIK